MYNITVEPEIDLVTIELEGFWSEEKFKTFIAEQHESLALLKCRPGNHLLLCDLTKFNVVAQDVAPRIAIDLNSQGPRDAEWIAIAVSSALLKLQMQRLLTRTNAQIFDDVRSAREWLVSSSRTEISK
jgi:hypothetical protein